MMVLGRIGAQRGGRIGLICVWLLLIGCNYARMTTDESYDTYEAELPQMPPGSISMDGNTSAYRLLGPAALRNPLDASPRFSLRGRVVYGYFCDHCHGPRGNGFGTVGQSFAPLPTNLSAARVQAHSDEELYFKIAYGFGRHPQLVHSMVEEDIWSVIRFLRNAYPADRQANEP